MLYSQIKKIVELKDNSKFTLTYNGDMSLEDKIRSVAQKIYRAYEIFSNKAIGNFDYAWSSQSTKCQFHHA